MHSTDARGLRGPEWLIAIGSLLFIFILALSARRRAPRYSSP